MKFKIFICSFFLCLIMPLSVFAETFAGYDLPFNVPSDVLDVMNDNPYVVVVYDSLYDLYSFLYNDVPFQGDFINDNTQFRIYPSDGLSFVYNIYYSSGDVYLTGFSDEMFTSDLSDASIIASTHDITSYSDNAQVFFSAPTKSHPVEILPQLMVRYLMDGGLLSKGLMILALMLGVSLVPRLIRSFHH